MTRLPLGYLRNIDYMIQLLKKCMIRLDYKDVEGHSLVLCIWLNNGIR